MKIAEKFQRNEIDRRERECSLTPGMIDRRLRAERRYLSVAQIPFSEWAETASNFYFHPPLVATNRPRRRADRRISECGPPACSAERRVTAERRRPDVENIPIGEWADAMSNYYFHFHRI